MFNIVKIDLILLNFTNDKIAQTVQLRNRSRSGHFLWNSQCCRDEAIRATPVLVHLL